MDDKIIYTAREEGYNKTSNIISDNSVEYFFTFMNYIKQLSIQDKIDPELIRRKVLIKAAGRKELIKILSK